jgi:hypothetical protein
LVDAIEAKSVPAMQKLAQASGYVKPLRHTQLAVVP